MRHLDLGKYGLQCAYWVPGAERVPSRCFHPPIGLASGHSPEEREVVFLLMRSDYEAGKGKGVKNYLVNRIVEAELPAESSPGADNPLTKVML